MSREEQILQAILNSGEYNKIPLSRLERDLIGILQQDKSLLEAPQSRVEELLHLLYDKVEDGSGGGGTPAVRTDSYVDLRYDSSTSTIARYADYYNMETLGSSVPPYAYYHDDKTGTIKTIDSDSFKTNNEYRLNFPEVTKIKDNAFYHSAANATSSVLKYLFPKVTYIDHHAMGNMKYNSSYVEGTDIRLGSDQPNTIDLSKLTYIGTASLPKLSAGQTYTIIQGLQNSADGLSPAINHTSMFSKAKPRVAIPNNTFFGCIPPQFYQSAVFASNKLKIKDATLSNSYYNAQFLKCSAEGCSASNPTKIWISKDVTMGNITKTSTSLNDKYTFGQWNEVTANSSCLQLYTDADTAPSTWWSGFNGCYGSLTYQVHYGVSEQEFDALP